MSTVVSTPDAPHPSGSYSQGLLAGNLLFTAGMGPHDPTTGEVRGTSIEEQTRHTLSNLDAVLTAAGMQRSDVVKVTAHLARLEEDFASYDEVYRQFFEPPYPTRTTVGSVLSGILLEVDLIAVRRDESRG